MEIHLLMMWTNTIKLPFCKIIFLLFCFLTPTANAVNLPGKTNKTVQYDSSSVLLKKISPEALNELRTDADYNYTKEVGTQPKSPWDRFWDWFWDKISELFDTQSGSITIKVIRYTFIIGAVTLIIFLFLKGNVRALFYGKSASVSSDFLESFEDIQEINFDKRIAEEVNRRDFRKAVRLYFLKIIKELNQQNLISWKLDKTNSDYLKELHSSNYYNQFYELSRLYEYIWYGDFKLDEANFLIVIQKFNQFKINQPD